MQNRILKKIKKLRRGNAGSAIVVVLVSMTFVIVLASILMYLALVNVQMKKMEKGEKTNFYSAEAVMSEIRAGIQGSVSEAIKGAYSTVLVSYNTLSKDDQIKNFNQLFYTNLYASVVAAKPLFSADRAQYDKAVLLSFVSNTAGVTVSGSQDVQQTTDGTGAVTSVTLKGIVVRYIAGGYQTTVSSDILITTPALPYTMAKITQTPAPYYAIIAKGLLQQPAGAGTVGVAGSVYAGGLTVGGNGDIFTVTGADNFVLADSVNVNGGTLTFGANSPLWTKNIKLDLSGRITLNGDVYVANDLNLLGSGTQAVLSGRYYGYGNSLTDPNSSSAILINGRDTVLDMSSLRALMLAGRSFVDYNAGANSTVLTGESISVKPNQLAYLIPDGCLTNGVTNPYSYTGTAPANLQNNVSFNQPSLTSGKKLSDYGITSTANIQLIYKNIGTTNLVYFCMKFPSADMANAYFKDYYGASKASVQKYLDLYSNGIVLNTGATQNMSGDGLTFDGANLGFLNPSGVPEASIAGIAASYANLCVTLSRTDSGAAATAYDYYVDTAQLSAVSGIRTYSLGGVPKVIVTSGSYTIDSGTDGNVHIVIASGNVTVRRSFTGLIFAGGTVTLYSPVTASNALVQDALQALSNDDDHDGVNVYYYLYPQHISPLNVSTSTSGVNGWDLSALVTFRNWAKNAA